MAPINSSLFSIILYFSVRTTLYSRSKIKEVTVKKHNYICRYNNLPTTCFGRDRPSSGWDTKSEENICYKYRYGGTRSRLQIYGACGQTGVRPQAPYICKRDLVPHTYTYNRYFSSDVSQPEDGLSRPKHVVGRLLYLKI